MQAVILTGDTYTQLLEDVRAVVRHEIQNAPAAPTTGASPAADELLTIREAAALLDVTVQTVHEWKRRGLLNFHKLGSRSYLKRGEVLAALTAQRRTTKPSKSGKGASRA
jgi:excisionase family DNA binding protein